MSKYNKLWKYIRKTNEDKLVLTYEEVEKIAGVAVDHSFLAYKKELLDYGYKVGKISMKAKIIEFIKEGQNLL